MVLIGIIVVIIISVCGAAFYIFRAVRQTEKEKYYDAAYRILKEKSLDDSIRIQSSRMQKGRKLMLYLKWKDTEKHGYVFDPEQPVWIGRDPETSSICIREGEISSKHCVLYFYQGAVYLEDLHSRNGTWLRQGNRTRRVEGPCPVYSGDRIMAGSLIIRVILFEVDAAYM